tara:strand:+ start:266 stop:1102 length:837 start_codon:yes stop_codon:yes gene_type:complete
MKTRYNKKRNTAFVYEALIREGTSAILQKDDARCNKVISIIQEHFKPGTILRKDLECYQSLYENQSTDKNDCKNIIKEARLQKSYLNPEILFKEQTSLIHSINKEIESSVFDNFVPNYKSLANIYQMFSFASAPKEKVLLEKAVIEDMIITESTDTEAPDTIDDIVVESFVKRFNEKYESTLLQEQKTLLNLYIKSFVDNSLEFKVYLNEEIARLKKEIQIAKNQEDIAKDPDMVDKTDQVITKLDSFCNTEINENIILSVLRIQSLCKETSQDASLN